ncbi:MAG: hypothetical protein SFX73_08620, partial [Kofleriaceae bacterium]|nr:hypothetical protein [Kofleriaceae bacterium]
MTTKRARALWALVMGLYALGCGGGAGGCPAGTRSVEGGCVELSDAGRTSTDAQLAPDASTEDAGALALDAEPSCDPSAPDPIDLTDTDENCDGVDGDRDAQWYVSPIGDDANVGSSEAPFATLERALRASPSWPILMATGNYAPARDQYAVRGREAVHGGFTADWRRDPDARSVLVLPTSQGIELVFFDESPELVLERVELRGADAQDASEEGADGASALGLALRADATAVGARAELRDVLVRAGAGGAARGSLSHYSAPDDGALGVEGMTCVPTTSTTTVLDCDATPVPATRRRGPVSPCDG